MKTFIEKKDQVVLIVAQEATIPKSTENEDKSGA